MIMHIQSGISLHNRKPHRENSSIDEIVLDKKIYPLETSEVVCACHDYPRNEKYITGRKDPNGEKISVI